MNDGKISVRYARALYSMACEQHCEKVVYESLRHFSDGIVGDLNAFQTVLKNPIISKEDRIQLLKTAIGTTMPECLESFIGLVVEHHRECKMYLIALKYQEQYRKDKNILLTNITTASELNEDALKKIEDYIKKTFNSEIETKTTIDPGLIGGYTIDIESNRWDASIAGRLKRLKEELKSN